MSTPLRTRRVTRSIERSLRFANDTRPRPALPSDVRPAERPAQRSGPATSPHGTVRRPPAAASESLDPGPQTSRHERSQREAARQQASQRAHPTAPERGQTRAVAASAASRRFASISSASMSSMSSDGRSSGRRSSNERQGAGDAAPRRTINASRFEPSKSAASTASRPSARSGLSGRGPNMLANAARTDRTRSVGAVALAEPREQPKSAERDAESTTAPTKPTKSTLHVVAKSTQIRRPMRGRVRVFFGVFVTLAVVVVVGFAAVALNARLAKDQLVLDAQKTQVEAEDRAYQRLRVEVAELEAPDRIVAMATSLGMTTPNDVTFMRASAVSATTPTTASLGAPTP